MTTFILFIFLGFITNLFLKHQKKKYPYLNTSLLMNLFFYHTLFFGIYFTYAMFRPSDSKRYYQVSYFADSWLEHFKSGTDFISFLAIPFVKMGFSYADMMLLFSWFGYLGFLYAYLFFRENIPEKVKIFGVDFLMLLLFLPNMHFWTASLGKGSIIFLGLMMMAYAIRNPRKRIISLAIGAFLVYMVRPHVMLFVMVGILFGYFFGREKVGIGTKIFILISFFVFLFIASDSILKLVNLENSENLTQDFLEYSELQSQRLAESSGSGVDMNNYSLPFKFFTFWFRPLFIDAPNALGLITSFENLLYLLIFFKILHKDFFVFLRKSPRIVKTSITIFLLATFALTFLMSNLGIIMRQKSQVMYFAFFVIYYYLAVKQFYRRKAWQEKMKKRKKLNEQLILSK